MSVLARNHVNVIGGGTEPTIVFSHGFGCDQQMWRFIAPRFAGRHRVVGHSVSSMIGLLAAIAEPDRFGRLVLVGPSARYIDDEGYRGGFSQTDIDEMLESLDSNYLG